MKIAVFGASGKTGRLLVDQALEEGHLVTAFVRGAGKMALDHLHLEIVQGDVHDLPAVERAVKGQDAVISVLGPTGKQSDVMQAAGVNLTTTMEKLGVRRLIIMTGAGISDPLDHPGIVDKMMVKLLKATAGGVYEDSLRGVNAVRGSTLDWTVVRTPRLMDGDRTGNICVGYAGNGTGWQITRADAAAFILTQLKDPTYIRKSPMISN